MRSRDMGLRGRERKEKNPDRITLGASRSQIMRRNKLFQTTAWPGQTVIASP